MEPWQKVSDRIHNPEGEVTIAIVGKYTGLKDAYKSLIEALSHGGLANHVKVKLDWIESEIFEKEDPTPWLEKVHDPRCAEAGVIGKWENVSLCLNRQCRSLKRPTRFPRKPPSS